MWDITLRILSIVGIILLILFGLLLVCILLFLFCPVAYRLQGKKTPEERSVSARASWLFGILRLCYSYPEPGTLTVKVLWKTVFDSSRRKEKPGDTGREKKKKKKKAGSGQGKEETAAEEKPELPEGGDLSGGEVAGDEKDGTETMSEADAASGGAKGAAEEADSGSAEEKPDILEKAGKIKYTIQEKCDKIKEIWENLSCYAQLLREENTVQLWRHVTLRLAKILKSIRPRYIRADILFGAAAPDTTGYVYGFYCMLSPGLGEKVVVTPDFTQAILQGEAELSGKITGGVLVWNSLKLLFDRKLHLFLKKIKAGRRRDGR